MPKEREREREKEGLRRANREIERERDHVVEPIPQIANPEIAKPIRHRSSRTQKSPHHSSNPFVKPEIIPPNRRSACSLWSLIFLLLLWWRGWFLFCCSLILGWSLIWWFFFCWVLRIWVLLDLMIYLFGSWENVRNMIKMGFLEHFQEYNQAPENIFQNIFWNATKHLKIFSFPENIFLSRKYFKSNQTQP